MNFKLVIATLLAIIAYTMATTCVAVSADATFCKEFLPSGYKVADTVTNQKTSDDAVKFSYEDFISATGNTTIAESCSKLLKQTICTQYLSNCGKINGIVAPLTNCKSVCTKVYNECKEIIKGQTETDYQIYCSSLDNYCYSGSSNANAVKASTVLTIAAIIVAMVF
jgi:hypothetical protein